MRSRRSEDDAHEELLQQRLLILVERLSWSYAALWTLNPRTRLLEWKRGQFKVTGSKAGTSWDVQLFYTTYKSCSFAPGTGAVGRANLEGRHIWLTGDSVCQNAGSLEKSQFLRCAKIETVMCIPWLDSVLEIGTINVVGENFQLMDQVQQLLSNDLLAPPPLQHPDFENASQAAVTIFQGSLGFPQDSANDPTNLARQQPSSRMRSPSTLDISLQLPEDLNQPFQSEFNLSDQIWRSTISPCLSLNSDIFMQDQLQPDNQPNPDMDVKENLSFRLDSAGPSSLQMPSSNALAGWRSEVNFRDNSQQVNQSMAAQTASHGLMVSQADQYRSWSGAATSSSGDSSSRPSVSPELQHQVLASPPHSRNSTLDRTSSSVRFNSQLGDAYNFRQGSRNLNQNLRRTTSCGDQHEIQKALSLFEAQEMQEQWRRQQLNPASQAPVNTDDPASKRLRSSPDAQDSLSPANQYKDQHTNTQTFPFQAGWQHDPALQKINNPSNRLLSSQIKRSSNASLVNQVSKIAGPLMRRQSLSALEVLKEVDTYHQDTAIISFDQAHNMSREPVRPASNVQINTPSLRGRRRWGVEHAITASTGSGPGAVHAGHDEAAVNHMLAERRRRVKQKENFTALRRLVPIISKADKASTLIDAITYLKDLQNKIQEMEASKEDIVLRCESLENKCKELEDRNQDLVAILSKDQPGHLNHLKLHSMKSM